MNLGPTVGVLALQGAFAAHASRLSELGAAPRLVRGVQHLEGLDALVLPGGESTTMSNLLVSSGLDSAISSAINHGLPVLGTCAGMILLADSVLDGRPDQISFGSLDITVRRNGYGRQVDSFETDLNVASLEAPYHAVFIRAPVIERVGAGVDVLAEHAGRAVLVGCGRVMAVAFHPELTDDTRIHRLFLDRCVTAGSSVQLQSAVQHEVTR